VPWTEAIGHATRLEIEVLEGRDHAHREGASIEQRANGAAPGPDEQIRRDRLKAVVPTQRATRSHGSRTWGFASACALPPDGQAARSSGQEGGSRTRIPHQRDVVAGVPLNVAVERSSVPFQTPRRPQRQRDRGVVRYARPAAAQPRCICKLSCGSVATARRAGRPCTTVATPEGLGAHDVLRPTGAQPVWGTAIAADDVLLCDCVP
jgi:hypothetical protein